MVLSHIGLTGASGMVGRHVLAEAARRGIAVTATSRRAPDKRFGACDWREWDLRDWRDPAQLDAIFQGVSVLFHAGAAVPGAGRAISDAECLAANVGACRALGLWASARGVKLVYLSGAIVYGPSLPGETIEEDAVRGPLISGGYYGLSKYLAELVLENLVPGGLDLVLLRPSSIYGHGLDPAKMLCKMLGEAKTAVKLSQPVEDRFDLIHASDVARAMLDVAEKDCAGAYNIGGGMKSLTEIARIAADLEGGAVEIDSAPAQRPAADRFPISWRKAERDFGYRPEIDLADGLRRLRDGIL